MVLLFYLVRREAVTTRSHSNDIDNNVAGSVLVQKLH